MYNHNEVDISHLEIFTGGHFANLATTYEGKKKNQVFHRAHFPDAEVKINTVM